MIQSIKRPNEIYTGSTNNLRARISEHNQSKVISTKRYIPWRIIYCESFLSEKDARIREQKFKRHGRSNIELKKRLRYSLNYNKKVKNGEGFTLSELLVTIAIIGILSLIAFPYYQSSKKNLALQRSVSSLAQDIRRAQEMAMSAKEFSICGANFGYSYGVFLKIAEPEKYMLFADCNGNGSYGPGTDEIVEEISFEKGIEIDSLSNSVLDVIFSPPDPNITIRGGAPAIIVLKNEIGKTKTINVNEVGLINIQ